MKKNAVVRRSLLIVAILLTWPLTVLAQGDDDWGKYLVYGPAGCANCHGQNLDGQNTPPLFIPPLSENVIHPPSLRGLKDRYSQEQLINAIRAGIRPDGTGIYPPMPIAHFQHGFCENDLRAIADYILGLEEVSGSSPVPANTFLVPAPVYDVAPMPPCPAPNDALATGRLFLEQAHCTECHGKDYNGGQVFTAPPDGTPIAIAPSVRHIADWSPERIARVLTTGKAPGGRVLKIMCPTCFQGLTSEHMDALIDALKGDIAATAP